MDFRQLKSYLAVYYGYVCQLMGLYIMLDELK